MLIALQRCFISKILGYFSLEISSRVHAYLVDPLQYMGFQVQMADHYNVYQQKEVQRLTVDPLRNLETLERKNSVSLKDHQFFLFSYFLDKKTISCSDI